MKHENARWGRSVMSKLSPIGIAAGFVEQVKMQAYLSRCLRKKILRPVGFRIAESHASSCPGAAALGLALQDSGLRPLFELLDVVQISPRGRRVIAPS